MLNLEVVKQTVHRYLFEKYDHTYCNRHDGEATADLFCDGCINMRKDLALIKEWCYE